MKRVLTYGIVIVFAIGIFQTKVGWEKLNPQEDRWLMARYSDYFPDYLIWRYFAQVETDGFPDTLNYAYPQKISPIYTNIIPLFAFPAQWTGRGQEGEVFQYFGWWILLCFILQAITGMYFLFSLGIRNELWVLIGACFFVIAAPFLDRFGHLALIHHWMVIAGLIPFFKRWSSTSSSIWYVVLACVAATTHPYMLLFAWGLPVIYAIRAYRQARDSIGKLLAVAAVPTLFSTIILWLQGAFQYDSAEAASWGFGFYSANLNTFYNNIGKTNAPLEFNNYHEGEYEGFAYLGLGILLLALPMVIQFRKRWREGLIWLWKRWGVLVLGTLAFTFFAFSDVWTLHEIILVSWPDDLLEKYYSIFRSSGRYIWLAYYLMIGSILWLWTKMPLKKHVITATLLLALIVQLWDMQPLIQTTFHENREASAFVEKDWDVLFEPFDQIVVYPPYQRGLYDRDVGLFIYEASWEAKPITTGHLPRPDETRRAEYSKQIEEFFAEGYNRAGDGPFRSTLFLTTVEFLPVYRDAMVSGELVGRKKGPFILLVTKDFEEAHPQHLSRHTEPFEADEVTVLSDWLNERTQGDLIILCQDECTRHAGSQFKEWMAERKSAFDRVGFRDAYIAHFRDGRLIEEKWDDEMVEYSMQSNGKKWVFHSEGNRAGNQSFVQINDKEFDDLSRGLNIFHITKDDHTIVWAEFDTYISSILRKERKFRLNEGER